MKLSLVAFLTILAPCSAFVPTATRLDTSVSSKLFGVSEDSSGAREMIKDTLAQVTIATLMSFSLLSSPLPAMADGQTEKFRLPPIDFNDKTRCSLSSSTIGQANAARDKLYDLRQCKLSGADAPGFDLSGVIMTDTDVSKANFKEAYFSKGYLQCECEDRYRMGIICHFLVVLTFSFLYSIKF